MNSDQNLTYTSPLQNKILVKSEGNNKEIIEEEDKEVLLLKCKTAIEELHWELEKVTNEKHELESKNHVLLSDFKEIQIQAKQTIEDFETIQKDLDEERGRNKNLKERIAFLDEEMNMIGDIQQKYDHSKLQFQEMCDLNTAQKQTIDNQNLDIQKFKSLQFEWQQTIDNVNGQIRELSLENEELKVFRQTQDEKILQLENMNRMLEENNSNFKIGSQRLENQVQELQDAIDKAESIGKDNVQILDQKYREKIEILSQRNRELESENEQFRFQRELEKQKSEDMEKKYQEKQKLLQLQNNQLAEQNEMAKEKQIKETKNMQDMIDEQANMIKQYEVIVDKAKHQQVEKKIFDEVKEKNAFLTKRLEDCQRELKQLQVDMFEQFDCEEEKQRYIEKKAINLERLCSEKDEEIYYWKAREIENSQDIPLMQKQIFDLQEQLMIKDKLLDRMGEEEKLLQKNLHDSRQQTKNLALDNKDLNSQLHRERVQKNHQQELLQNYQTQTGLLERSNIDNMETLKKELISKDVEILNLRQRYDNSVEKIIEQRKNLESQGRLLEMQSQNGESNGVNMSKNTIKRSLLSPQSTKASSPKYNYYNQKRAVENPYKSEIKRLNNKRPGKNSKTSSISTSTQVLNKQNPKNLSFQTYRKDNSIYQEQQQQGNGMSISTTSPFNYNKIGPNSTKQRLLSNGLDIFKQTQPRTSKDNITSILKTSPSAKKAERLLDDQYMSYQTMRAVSPQRKITDDQIKNDRENIRQFQKVSYH